MDEDLLVCDFAEFYHLFNYRELPLKYAAALYVGLPEKARIKMKLSGAKIDTQTALLAIIADRLGLLVWQNSTDGRKGTNKPKSIFEAMTTEETTTLRRYENGEEFRKAWENALSERRDNIG
jgi:hypothetical protein